MSKETTIKEKEMKLTFPTIDLSKRDDITERWISKSTIQSTFKDEKILTFFKVSVYFNQRESLASHYFLFKLFRFLAKKSDFVFPINPVFQIRKGQFMEVNLYLLFKIVQYFGGYDACGREKNWLSIYNHFFPLNQIDNHSGYPVQKLKRMYCGFLAPYAKSLEKMKVEDKGGDDDYVHHSSDSENESDFEYDQIKQKKSRVYQHPVAKNLKEEDEDVEEGDFDDFEDDGESDKYDDESDEKRRRDDNSNLGQQQQRTTNKDSNQLLPPPPHLHPNNYALQPHQFLKTQFQIHPPRSFHPHIPQPPPQQHTHYTVDPDSSILGKRRREDFERGGGVGYDQRQTYPQYGGLGMLQQEEQRPEEGERPEKTRKLNEILEGTPNNNGRLQEQNFGNSQSMLFKDFDSNSSNFGK